MIINWESPNVGQYHMNELPNNKEAIAKISVLVTILWIKSLNETEEVKIGPCIFSIKLCYVTTNWLISQKTAPLKFIRLLKWSCLGHNNTKQAKNPECQAGLVDIAVEQCALTVSSYSLSSDSCLIWQFSCLTVISPDTWQLSHLTANIWQLAPNRRDGQGEIWLLCLWSVGRLSFAIFSFDIYSKNLRTLSNVSIDKVRSFATDLVRSLSSCFGQLQSCRGGNSSQNSCLSTSACLASNHYSSSQLPALNCLASTHSQLLYAVKTKLAVQFSRQLLRRTTVNHLVISIQIRITQ